MNLYPQSMGMDGGEAGKLMMEDMAIGQILCDRLFCGIKNQILITF